MRCELNKKVIYLLFIILFVSFIPKIGWSQTSFYKLPKYHSSFGISFTQSEWEFYDIKGNIRSFVSSIDYGYMPDVKISVIPAISFTSTNANIDVPPSPYVGIGIMSATKLPSSNLHYYFSGVLGAGYAQASGRVYGGIRDTFHAVVVSLGGGLGIFHRVDTNSDLSFMPFFGVNYSNLWNNLSTTSQTYDDSTVQKVTGHAGIEVEMSSDISISGTWNFSFMEAGGTFTFGLNFH